MYLLLKQKHMLYLLHFFKRCFYFFLFQSDCLFTCMCLYIHTYIVHTNIQLWILRSQDHIVIFFCLGEEACKFDHLVFFFFFKMNQNHRNYPLSRNPWLLNLQTNIAFYLLVWIFIEICLTSYKQDIFSYCIRSVEGNT